MAITNADYTLIRLLRKQGALKLQGRLLEIGESNFYGDLDPSILQEDAQQYANPEDCKWILENLQNLANLSLVETEDHLPTISFGLAKMFWKIFLDPLDKHAFDLHGYSDYTREVDLNCDYGEDDLGAPYDTVVNLGTLEHVFDIAQAFATIHKVTKPGGLMYHQSPFQGWHDHGFYSVHPTLFWDLAEANDYQVVMALYAELNPPKAYQFKNRQALGELLNLGQLNGDSLILFALRKPDTNKPFCKPRQHRYS